MQETTDAVDSVITLRSRVPPAELSDGGLVRAWNVDQDDMMRWMRFLHGHHDGFTLLLRCSEGTRWSHFSRYASFLHDLALEEEKTTMAMMDLLRASGIPIRPVDPMEFHLLVTANVNAVFQAVEHGFTREEALHYADTLDRFFSRGWQEFFGF